MLLAIWGIDALLSLNPDPLPRQAEIHIDARAMVFTFGVALLTGLVFGLIPAIQASATDPHQALKEGGRSSASGSQRFRSALVVAEVGLAIVLLVGAGLLIRSLTNVLNETPGFRSDQLLTMSARLPRRIQRSRTTRRLLAQLRRTD